MIGLKESQVFLLNPLRLLLLLNFHFLLLFHHALLIIGEQCFLIVRVGNFKVDMASAINLEIIQQTKEKEIPATRIGTATEFHFAVIGNQRFYWCFRRTGKRDFSAIDKATAELSAVWQTASEELYKNQQAGPQGPQEGYTADAGQAQGNTGQSKKDDEVTDVDFEEVK